MYKKMVVIISALITSVFAPSTHGMDNQYTIQEVTIDIKNQINNRAVLIFLDDSESNFGAVTISFLTAFLQEAGPIIVSSSVIDNLRFKKKLDEAGKQKIIEQTIKSQEKKVTLSGAENDEIIRYAADFDQESLNSWIIKEITPELYLLVPKRYLKMLNLTENEVKTFTKDGSLTSTEQQLGLKVNHMRTITDTNDIKKISPEPQNAYYFIDALKNIFLVNREYHDIGNVNIPTWTIFISGHGTTGFLIADLLIAQFKDFLKFMGTNINVKLFYYWSCYAAGVTNAILYEDIKSGIDKTYPFAIITQAITDAVVKTFLYVYVENKNLKFKTFKSYDDFVNQVMNTDIVDYKKLVLSFDEPLSLAGIGSALAQLKLPGLPWFSAIAEDKICSIGSILAKTRIQALNIETFFARKGKNAAPLGILLYTVSIPFELIINSKIPTTKLPPAIISMVPGNTIHQIKKISSSVHSIEDLINNFSYIENLAVQKIFFIQEMESKKGLFSTTIIHNVVIELTPQQKAVYHTQNGMLFKNMTPATPKDSAHYEELFAIVQPSKMALQLSKSALHPKMNTVSKKVTKEWQDKADEIFISKNMTFKEVGTAIIKFLDDMPNNVILSIPELSGYPCPTTNNRCWLECLSALTSYASPRAQKIIWFDQLELYNEKNKDYSVLFKNIIIDVNDDSTTIFFTDTTQGTMSKFDIKTGLTQIQEDYVPEYREILQYFETHRYLPERKKATTTTKQDLLTPETISNIKKVQEQKAQKINTEQQKQKEQQYKQSSPPSWLFW